MSLSITVSSHNGIEVLGLSGRLDTVGAAAIDAWAVEQSHIPLVFDISGVTYLSSIGIRSLLQLDKALRATGLKPVLMGMTPSVRDVMNVTGLLGHWDAYPTLDDAAEALAGITTARPASGFMTPSGAVYQHS
ncbi:MAG: STAS domain-containing protein [Armatimonadota bacterium]